MIIDVYVCLYVRERERDTLMWQMNINWLPPTYAPTGDQTCNLGLCPGQESNSPPFGVWDDAPTN